MNVFDLRDHIIGDYAEYSRSLTKINASDLKEKLGRVSQPRKT